MNHVITIGEVLFPLLALAGVAIVAAIVIGVLWMAQEFKH